MISEQRKYVALSIKHSKYRGITFWGHKGPTDDDEDRCFAGYTRFLEDAELYSLDEFKDRYGAPSLFLYTPIKACNNLIKEFADYDTVFLTIADAKKLEGYRPKPRITNWERYFSSPEKVCESILDAKQSPIMWQLFADWVVQRPEKYRINRGMIATNPSQPEVKRAFIDWMASDE